MSLLSLVPTETHHELAELIAPTWVFPLIAAAFFILITAVSFSYRDVWHRHNDKVSDAGDGAHH